MRLATLVQYLHSTVDRQLAAAILPRAQQKGLSNVLEVPGAEPPYLARLVVRDRVNRQHGHCGCGAAGLAGGAGR